MHFSRNKMLKRKGRVAPFSHPSLSLTLLEKKLTKHSLKKRKRKDDLRARKLKSKVSKASLIMIESWIKLRSKKLMPCS